MNQATTVETAFVVHERLGSLFFFQNRLMTNFRRRKIVELATNRITTQQLCAGLESIPSMEQFHMDATCAACSIDSVD